MANSKVANCSHYYFTKITIDIGKTHEISLAKSVIPVVISLIDLDPIRRPRAQPLRCAAVAGDGDGPVVFVLARNGSRVESSGDFGLNHHGYMVYLTLNGYMNIIYHLGPHIQMVLFLCKM